MRSCHPRPVRSADFRTGRNQRRIATRLFGPSVCLCEEATCNSLLPKATKAIARICGFVVYVVVSADHIQYRISCGSPGQLGGSLKASRGGSGPATSILAALAPSGTGDCPSARRESVPKRPYSAESGVRSLPSPSTCLRRRLRSPLRLRPLPDGLQGRIRAGHAGSRGARGPLPVPVPLNSARDVEKTPVRPRSRLVRSAAFRTGRNQRRTATRLFGRVWMFGRFVCISKKRPVTGPPAWLARGRSLPVRAAVRGSGADAPARTDLVFSKTFSPPFRPSLRPGIWDRRSGWGASFSGFGIRVFRQDSALC